jgi:hypothetical protein
MACTPIRKSDEGDVNVSRSTVGESELGNWRICPSSRFDQLDGDTPSTTRQPHPKLTHHMKTKPLCPYTYVRRDSSTRLMIRSTIILEQVFLRALDSPNIQTADTCSPLSLDLEDLNQLSVTLSLKLRHVLARQLITDACRKCVDVLWRPGESILLHVLCPALRGRSEVF